MSDQLRRRLKPVVDDGYEVVEPPPAAKPPAAPPALAKPVVAKRAAPPPPPDDDDEDDDRRWRTGSAAKPHWFFRYVINLRGLIALACLSGFLTVARVAMWLTREAPPPTPQPAGQPVGPVGPAGNPPAARVPSGLKAADIGPAPAEPPPLPAGWQEYTDHLGTFVARVPDGPTAAAVAVQAWGSQAVKPRGVRWENGPLTYYLIVVEEWPPNRGGNAPSRDDRQLDMINSSHVGWFSSYVRLPVIFAGGGWPEPVWLTGKRAAGVSQNSVDGTRVLHLRGLVADGFGYYLAVVGPKEVSDKSPEVAPFFDGFKLTPGAAPPAGATAPTEATPPNKSPTRRKKG